MGIGGAKLFGIVVLIVLVAIFGGAARALWKAGDGDYDWGL